MQELAYIPISLLVLSLLVYYLSIICLKTLSLKSNWLWLLLIKLIYLYNRVGGFTLSMRSYAITWVTGF